MEEVVAQPKHKITLTPEQMAALETEGTKLVQPLSQEILMVIRRRVVSALYGPSMRPWFKHQLLAFVSFAAIKSSWAADYWQLKMKERRV